MLLPRRAPTPKAPGATLPTRLVPTGALNRAASSFKHGLQEVHEITIARARATPTTSHATIHGLMDGDGPRFGAMIGLVAIVVATVILVFFGIGYLLGRVFL